MHVSQAHFEQGVGHFVPPDVPFGRVDDIVRHSVMENAHFGNVHIYRIFISFVADMKQNEAVGIEDRESEICGEL